MPQVEQEPLTLTVSDCPFGIFKLLLWTTENLSAQIIVEGWYFVIANHCEKVLLNSFLSFKGQGLKLRVFNGKTILVPQQIL